MVLKIRNICLKCRVPYINYESDYYFYTDYDGNIWCYICSAQYLQENFCAWSRNERIDNFIKEKQQKSKHPTDFFEWIPYNKFKNIKRVRKEGFSEIYSAIWIDGCLETYNEETHEIRQHGELEVALKCLNVYKNLSDDYLNEVYIDSIS